MLIIGVIATVGISVPLADAITREEIADMRERENVLRERSLEIEALLEENTAERQEIERLLETYRAELKQLKRDANSSWDAAKAIDDKRLEIVAAERDNREKQNVRNDLFDERNDILKERERLESDIDSGNILAKALDFEPGELKKAIGIKLSNNCIAAIMANLTTACPTYEELSQLDSSVQSVSGNFTNEGGYFHRDSSPLKSSWRWYDHDDQPRIFVDPPQGMAERIPMITIENNFGIYFLAGDHLLENGTRSYHEGRFIDNCRNATLDTGNWTFTLPHTLFVMRGGCQDTNEIDKQYVYHNATEINVAESNDWKYKAWLADTKEACKTICKEY